MESECKETESYGTGDFGEITPKKRLRWERNTTVRLPVVLKYQAHGRRSNYTRRHLTLSHACRWDSFYRTVLFLPHFSFQSFPNFFAKVHVFCSLSLITVSVSTLENP